MPIHNLPTRKQCAKFKNGICLRFSMKVQYIQQRLSLEGRYASALYTEASEKNMVNEVLQEIKQFNDLVEDNQQLRTIFKSQLITQKVMIKILSDLQAIAKYSELLLQFLIIVAKNKRLKLLPDIFTVFGLIVDNADNITQAKVEMAKLNTEDKLTIKKMITKKYPSQNIKYSFREIPDLIGGFRVLINSECLDYSLISRLNRLRHQLKEA